jgi:L-fucose isomerase-like protein
VSLLNEEGIIAGCEGDVPALISMMVLNYLTGEPAFMANPSSVDVWNNQAILAHCTLPLHMASKYNLDTHFESGLGVGIKGIIQTGKGTIFKLSGDLRRMFVSGINIRENLNNPNLCRTQIRVEIDENVNYFLKDPIGNHHIVCRGDYSGLIKEFFDYLM